VLSVPLSALPLSVSLCIGVSVYVCWGPDSMEKANILMPASLCVYAYIFYNLLF